MGNRERISVLIADDHTLVRAGVTALMVAEQDIRVVGETGDGEEAVGLYRKLSPNVLVLELRLRGITGLDVIREVLAIDRRAKMLVLTGLDGDHDITRALRAVRRATCQRASPRRRS